VTAAVAEEAMSKVEEAITLMVTGESAITSTEMVGAATISIDAVVIGVTEEAMIPSQVMIPRAMNLTTVADLNEEAADQEVEVPTNEMIDLEVAVMEEEWVIRTNMVTSTSLSKT
jgi:hypothetical protein